MAIGLARHDENRHSDNNPVSRAPPARGYVLTLRRGDIELAVATTLTLRFSSRRYRPPHRIPFCSTSWEALHGSTNQINEISNEGSALKRSAPSARRTSLQGNASTLNLTVDESTPGFGARSHLTDENDIWRYSPNPPQTIPPLRWPVQLRVPWENSP